MDYEDFDDTNILKSFFRFSHSIQRNHRREKRNHRRENGRKKRERKTEADDAGMDDRQIQRTKGKSTAQRGVASLEVGTCRRAENLKKNSYKRLLTSLTTKQLHISSFFIWDRSFLLILIYSYLVSTYIFHNLTIYSSFS